MCVRLILGKMKSFSNLKDLIEGACQISCKVTLDVQLKKKFSFYKKKLRQLRENLHKTPSIYVNNAANFWFSGNLLGPVQTSHFTCAESNANEEE